MKINWFAVGLGVFAGLCANLLPQQWWTGSFISFCVCLAVSIHDDPPSAW